MKTPTKTQAADLTRTIRDATGNRATIIAHKAAEIGIDSAEHAVLAEQIINDALGPKPAKGEDKSWNNRKAEALNLTDKRCWAAWDKFVKAEREIRDANPADSLKNQTSVYSSGAKALVENGGMLKPEAMTKLVFKKDAGKGPATWQQIAKGAAEAARAYILRQHEGKIEPDARKSMKARTEDAVQALAQTIESEFDSIRPMTHEEMLDREALAAALGEETPTTSDTPKKSLREMIAEIQNDASLDADAKRQRLVALRDEYYGN